MGDAAKEDIPGMVVNAPKIELISASSIISRGILKHRHSYKISFDIAMSGFLMVLLRFSQPVSGPDRRITIAGGVLVVFFYKK